MRLHDLVVKMVADSELCRRFMAIPGVGPVRAQAIVDYRAKNGPFKSVDDLEKVTGIGPATMKEIRGELSVSGATTPAPAAPPARR